MRWGWALFPLVIAAGCATSASDDTTPMDDGSVPQDAGVCTTKCDGGCTDLKTDPQNCGKCGKTCPMGATCVQGSCQCAMGQSICGTSCVDTKSDINNCGKCGTVCGGADAGSIMGGGTWTCMNGQCAIVCPMGDGGNGTLCDNSACVDVMTDNNNCGMCDNACAMNQTCMQGLCCNTGQTVCNGGADGGGPQCTDTMSDSQNCGGCGKVCSGMTPACAGGTCVACGNDCWSTQGCLTKAGHCVRFACRAGNAGGSFCNQCLGWTEITYNDWMNGGYCLDVFAAYYAQNGMTAMCGSVANCCSTQKNCGSGNVAWHFFDGSNNHYTGPSMFSTPQTANCSAFAGIDNSAYVRLSACKKY